MPPSDHSRCAAETAAANSCALLWAWLSRPRSFSHSRRRVSSFVSARRTPAFAMPGSAASSPSTQSRTSSLKAPWKTRAIVCCSLRVLASSTMEATIFIHCLGSSPERRGWQAAWPSAAGGGSVCVTSRRPRIESSRSFWSCSSLKRFRHSSCMAFAWRLCSSMALLSCASWVLLSAAFSSQVLSTIFCISVSWLWNFALSSAFSSSAAGPPPPPPPPPEVFRSFFFSSSISALSREICDASSFFWAETLMALARLA
mmetsp:Transcript_63677/g.205162  ORF Transcript_63677/g.205162 Transcript_63677/m.205162 type:complete len:257 (-) Transcript_63677:294-1064(-)